MSIVDLSKILRRDPEILGGTPVFAGIRLPAQSLFDLLEAGDSIVDFLEGFPIVLGDQVIARLQPFFNTFLSPP